MAESLRQERMLKVWALEYSKEKLEEEIAKIREEGKPKEDMTLTPYERAVIRKEQAQQQQTSIPEKLPYGCYGCDSIK